ncbi:MAG: FHA domain-containing protein [Gammaproteobacteria bacterium]|nr:FHA domain-containing protein [Gammaproteobacteria bacterium]
MKPIELKIDKLRLIFTSLTDFEFCLDARTEVPARKVTELLQRPIERLREEARSIRAVERRFTDVLANAIDDHTSLSVQMRQLDKHLFSQDFRWRSIMEAVNGLPHEEHLFRRTAMVRYLQYLRSRQEALRNAYEQRHHSDAPEEAPAHGASAMRETAIFDVSVPPASGLGEGLVVLPPGETVKIKLPTDTLELWLSRHRFELVPGNPFKLCDDADVSLPLRSGRSVIGRDVNGDVVIDPAYRDVSRRHLILDISGEWVQLTDLSSHGTKVALK